MTHLSIDPFDLGRFLEAQEGVYARALAEIRAGRKQTHWSWYVLPQLRGLGSSSMAERYGIGSIEEAQAYLDHAILGVRLRECVAAMNDHVGVSAIGVLGEVDAQKFRSCVTLFRRLDGKDSVFARALSRFFDGSPDQATLRILLRPHGGDAGAPAAAVRERLRIAPK